ncbi:hypothetical protein SLEP1_g26181 [Rubroshorea leprosula]|uniref:Uncharacterized protein n=1 Tax=Rubroshorea leprosula TaxID=152421 RepID=A0AAV5JSB9_9ROSI|nr:hypothetical protein SLEP1_g26181 [Rubroshorea leprosula]
MKGPSVVSKYLATSMLALQNIDLQDPPFKPSCTTAHKEWWKSYFVPSFFGVAENFINLLPSSQPNQSAVEIKSQVDDTVPESVTSSHTVAKKEGNNQTEKLPICIKRVAHKPPLVKRLATASSSSPFKASLAAEARLQSLIDEIIHNPIIKDPIDKSSSHECSNSSPSDIQKLPSKTKGTRSSLRLANKKFKIVNPNEVVDLSPKTRKTSSTTSTPFQASFPTPKTSTPLTTIDDAMEDEIFAKFEKLTSLHTLEELVNGDPANFCRIPDQPTIISAAKILNCYRCFADKSDVIGRVESAPKTVVDETATLTLERLIDSADQAEEELTLIRMEWSDWHNHFP